jgi:hypothetical protein
MIIKSRLLQVLLDDDASDEEKLFGVVVHIPATQDSFSG